MDLISAVGGMQAGFLYPSASSRDVVVIGGFDAWKSGKGAWPFGLGRELIKKDDVDDDT